MLQQLLVERFKLVVHRESKEVPLFALVPGKEGAKFKETEPDKLHQSPVYGVICMHLRSRRGDAAMSGCTLDGLAEYLSIVGKSELGRRVVNRTGMDGHYDLSVKWTPVSPAVTSPTAIPSSDTTEGPSLFTALKEQLGLELKPIKGPVETIVIDHVEMPTEN